MTTQAQPAIDEAKLNAFMMKAVGDMGAAAVCATILLGQDLGLYKALAGAGPITPAELAKKTKTNERLITEWLNAQAAGRLRDVRNGKYELPAEHAMALANEDSPVFIGGAFDVARHDVRLGREAGGRLPQRQGPRLEGPAPAALRRHGALLPPRLPHVPDDGLDPGAGRRRGEAQGRREGGGRGLWPRSLDDHHGPDLPQLDVRRLRLPRRLDQDGSRAGQGGRRGATTSSSRRRTPSHTRQTTST